MRALNIIRGISKALMFVVLYFILYNYTQVFKPWLLILPSHGITNQHRAGYQLL
jgi:hypothetical protein